MTDAKHDGHESNNGEQIVQELSEATSLKDIIDSAYSHTTPILDENGKQNTQATLDSLVDHGKHEVENAFPAAKADPSYLLSFDAVRSLYRSIEGAFKDNRMVARFRTAIVNAYEQTVQQAAIQKAIQRVQSLGLESAKKVTTYVVKAAGDFSEHMGKQIAEANSGAELSQYLNRSLTKIADNLREKYNAIGKPATLEPAYAGTTK